VASENILNFLEKEKLPKKVSRKGAHLCGLQKSAVLCGHGRCENPKWSAARRAAQDD
jgi:hypothetical protein